MTKPRQFIRQRGGVQAPGFDAATAFREALAADGAAEIWDTVPGAEPTLAFMLRAAGIAVLAVNPADQSLGVFADPMRAVAHGFELLDRETDQHRATRPRPTRARRRAAKENAAP